MASKLADSIKSRLPFATRSLAGDAPLPVAESDLASAMKLDLNVHDANTTTETIDVVPDTRYIVTAIDFHIKKLYSGITFKDHPFASPFGLMAYCLSVIYGHMLLCDVLVRHRTSRHASNFITNVNGRQLMETLASLPVPPFLIPILQTLMPFISETRPGLQFVPTLAPFWALNDYGRVLPISMFLTGHNLLAENPSNSAPWLIIKQWLNVNIVVFQPTIGLLKNGSLCGAFGRNQANATTDVYFNWFNTRLFNLLSPATARLHTARPILNAVNYTMQTFADYAAINPYEYVLGLDRRNHVQVSTFLKSMGHFVTSELKASATLSDVLEKSTGSTIHMHMISGPALPTYTTSSIGTPAYLGHGLAVADATRVPHTADEFQVSYGFMTDDDPTAALDTDVPRRHANPADATAHDFNFRRNFYLASGTAYDHAADPSKLMIYDPHRDETPRMLLFNPLGKPKSAFVNVISSGLLIESATIDGFGVPTPQPLKSPAFNNGQYLQGSIPVVNIRRFDSPAAVHIRARTLAANMDQHIATALEDMSRNRLPNIPSRIPAASLGLSFAANRLGLHATGSPIGSLYHQFTWSAQRSSDTQNRVAANSIWLWSSYRSITEDNFAQGPNDAALSNEKVFFYFTLRGLYGTEVQLGDCPHIAELIQA